MFGTLTEAQLRSRVEPEKGVFIAESPKVIRVALDAGYEPVSLLCERKHIAGDAADIVVRCGDLPVYTGERELLARLTGYTLTRGVLCAMRRPVMPSVEDVCRDARRVVVIDGVTDTTNIGAIFRSAAARGIDAVLLTPDACDPLNRRASVAEHFGDNAGFLDDTAAGGNVPVKHRVASVRVQGIFSRVDYVGVDLPVIAVEELAHRSASRKLGIEVEELADCPQGRAYSSGLVVVVQVVL